MSLPVPTVTRRRRAAECAAASLGLTRSEAGTAVVTLLVTAALAIGGLPPVLRQRGGGSVPEESAAPRVSGGRSAPAEPVSPTDYSPDPRLVLRPTPGDDPTLLPHGDSGSGIGTAPGAVGPPVGTASVFAPVGPPGAPDGIAVATDGTVYVATGNGTTQGEDAPSRILTFSARGTPGRSFGVTGQPEGHAIGLTGIALDGRGGLVALDAATGRVLRINLKDGKQTTVATLPDLPRCQLVIAATTGCEAGVQDHRPLPRGVALGDHGILYVTDAAQGIIWRIAEGGGPPEVFLADIAFASGDGLAGVAVDRDGNLVVASPQPIDPAAGGGGGVYRVPVEGSKPGGKSLLARFQPREGPSGVALVDDGSMVVTLRDAAAVVLLDSHGAEIRRVRGPAGDQAIDTPSGAAFNGPTLLVTNQSPTDPRGWAVLAVGIH